MIIQVDILRRQRCDDLGEFVTYMSFLAERPLEVLLQSLFETACKHRGVSKKMQVVRQKFLVSFNCNIRQKLGSRA